MHFTVHKPLQKKRKHFYNYILETAKSAMHAGQGQANQIIYRPRRTRVGLASSPDGQLIGVTKQLGSLVSG